MIWAAAGCAVYNKTGGLMTGLTQILTEQGQAAILFLCLLLSRTVLRREKTLTAMNSPKIK
ncbi:MAG: hypothetical protein ACI4HI_10920 [Lachnospiraceae bacterium]